MSSNDKTYKVRGTKFLLTYRGYLNEVKLSEFLNKLSPAKEIHVGLRDGETRVAIWFEQQFTSNNTNVFKFGNFVPIVQNKSKEK